MSKYETHARALYMCSPLKWSSILFKIEERTKLQTRIYQTHSAFSAKRCANRECYLLWNKRIPFFIDMLVIVFYRGLVLINQKVAAISIGFDKEIENALLTKSGIHSPRHPYSYINVLMCMCVSACEHRSNSYFIQRYMWYVPSILAFCGRVTLDFNNTRHTFCMLFERLPWLFRGV